MDDGDADAAPAGSVAREADTDASAARTERGECVDMCGGL